MSGSYFKIVLDGSELPYTPLESKVTQEHKYDYSLLQFSPSKMPFTVLPFEP